jgi:hypothetical protein
VLEVKPIRPLSWSRQRRYFPPSVGREPEGQLPQLERDGQGHLVGEESGLLEPGQEGLGEVGVPREAEGVDARGQLCDIRRV